MSDGFETLAGLWAAAWDVLAQGVASADHPARLAAFATVSPEGLPEVRTVVLRGVSAEAAELTVFTDARALKMASLAVRPTAALMVWDPVTALQIRVQASVTVEQGSALLPIWEKLPDRARRDYGRAPTPGQPIPQSLAYARARDPGAFSRLACSAQRIDLVHLGADHRRAEFTRSGDWRGQWLVP